MPTLSLCEREIRDLHDFFARWYCGRADPDEFRTVEQALVRYEECQERPDGTNGRISTALFGPARSPVADQQDVEWLYLHET